ncbi:hypothetical protein LTR57_019682 [Friedmanniomyces endolithicus]|nr:hypothetical protein LTR57_019682 [Friedmanniomyces endolithicus]
MGRQQYLTRLALGRSPFLEATNEQHADVKVDQDGHDASKTEEPAYRGYTQQYNSKGRPINPTTEARNAEMRRAQNSVLALVGVVESREHSQRESEVELRRANEELREAEDGTGFLLEIAHEQTISEEREEEREEEWEEEREEEEGEDSNWIDDRVEVDDETVVSNRNEVNNRDAEDDRNGNVEVEDTVEDEVDEADEVDNRDEVEDTDEDASEFTSEGKQRLSNVHQQTQQKAKKTKKKKKKKRSTVVQAARRPSKLTLRESAVTLPRDIDEGSGTLREAICLPTSKIDTSRVDFHAGRLAMQHSAKYALLGAEWEREYRDMLVELCAATEHQLTAFDEGTPQSEHLRGMLGYLQNFDFARIGTDVENCDECDVFVCHSEDMGMLCRRGVRFTCCVLIKDEPFNDVHMHSIDSYMHGLDTLYPNESVEVQDNNVAHKGKNGQRRNPRMSIREYKRPERKRRQSTTLK